jgi:hypothetical protein
MAFEEFTLINSYAEIMKVSLACVISVDQSVGRVLKESRKATTAAFEAAN